MVLDRPIPLIVYPCSDIMSAFIQSEIFNFRRRHLIKLICVLEYNLSEILINNKVTNINCILEYFDIDIKEISLI